ncbi:unknown protein [Desulfotalea psychrophila LSv54]|uniref:Uncharacterized protein n=1 Tax=Desulfotalea psychrophila (strain LSv54 / DSM 12343) TaxID=177439 RepID=Q6APF8_DESPS|nr:unknown protein [Desulfotalea psychrophila LSv54]
MTTSRATITEIGNIHIPPIQKNSGPIFTLLCFYIGAIHGIVRMLEWYHGALEKQNLGQGLTWVSRALLGREGGDSCRGASWVQVSGRGLPLPQGLSLFCGLVDLFFY